DAFEPEVRVALQGFGAAEPCPHAVITPGVPAKVAPGESVAFDGGASYGVGTTIATWLWSLEAPPGVVATLASPDAPSRAILSSSALGTHTVTLTVTDTDGLEACAPTHHAVEVSLDTGLIAEVWWHTPGDPDPTDTGLGTGSDLDLHLLHAHAVGIDVDGDGTLDGWFDKPFDVFWGNPEPNWGVVDEDAKTSDNPALTEDDFDGTGPERIVLEAPETGGTYRVGVHHWDDHGHGPATAWVRVWWDGQLVHEAGGVVMHEGTLWDVGTIGGDGVWTSNDPDPLVHTGVPRPESLKVQ
ncbi:MAG: hypothetical protein QF464_19115, partial [Myxococcota bacterium]|nr:hypothetical protein [Myxococcota bacterium]